MKNEEVSMNEMISIVLKSIQGVQDQLNDFQTEFRDFKVEVNQRLDRVEERLGRIELRLDSHETRFNRIEKQMVTKENFNHLFRALTKTLADKELLSTTESGYFYSQTQD